MNKEITKEYSNGELTIVWKPSKCIHSGECVKALPNVYKPKEKPWITIENATNLELKEQIKKCPSGALDFYMVNEVDEKTESVETCVEVLKDGPLLVHGAIKVKDIEGKETSKNRTTAFCRCGKSDNKPYCDGTHSKIEFRG